MQVEGWRSGILGSNNKTGENQYGGKKGEGSIRLADF